MRRVCFVADSLERFREQYASLAHELVNSGVAVELMACGVSGEGTLEIGGAQSRVTIPIADLPSLRAAVGPGSVSAAFVVISRLSDAPPDIVHSISTASHGVASLVGTTIPAVRTVWTLNPSSSVRTTLELPDQWTSLVGRVKAASLRAPDLVFTLDRETYREALELRESTRTTRLLECGWGVDVDEAYSASPDAARRAARRRLNVDVDAFVVALGGASRRRRPGRFTRSIWRLGESMGMAAPRPQTSTTIRPNEITGALPELVFADQGHIPAADLFVQLRTSRAPSSAAMRAAAHGVPVIAVDSPGARVVVRGGETGELVDGGDRAAEGIIDAIRRYQHEPARRAAHGAAAQARAFRLFDAQLVAHKAINAYREITGPGEELHLRPDGSLVAASPEPFEPKVRDLMEEGDT